jgi:hypothetical protein
MILAMTWLPDPRTLRDDTESGIVSMLLDFRADVNTVAIVSGKYPQPIWLIHLRAATMDTETFVLGDKYLHNLERMLQRADVDKLTDKSWAFRQPPITPRQAARGHLLYVMQLAASKGNQLSFRAMSFYAKFITVVVKYLWQPSLPKKDLVFSLRSFLPPARLHPILSILGEDVPPSPNLRREMDHPKRGIDDEHGEDVQDRQEPPAKCPRLSDSQRDYISIYPVAK